MRSSCTALWLRLLIVQPCVAALRRYFGHLSRRAATGDFVCPYSHGHYASHARPLSRCVASPLVDRSEQLRSPVQLLQSPRPGRSRSMWTWAVACSLYLYLPVSLRARGTGCTSEPSFSVCFVHVAHAKLANCWRPTAQHGKHSTATQREYSSVALTGCQACGTARCAIPSWLRSRKK